jgi:CRISPR system Cascade subunit CasD
MRAIALRLEGPMQSWGAQTAGDGRPTLDMPTKSGVLGLVAAALGLMRDAVEDLRRLHAGLGLVVRVDRPGSRGIDFHTAQEVPRAERGMQPTVVTRRGYLYDAVFTVLLVERDTVVPSLETMVSALRYPRFAPYLGRRACPPATRVLALPGVIEGSDWQELLNRIPVRRRQSVGPLDVYVDLEPAAVKEVHRLRVRDEVTGPLERLFAERAMVHVRLDSAGDADTAEDLLLP